MSLRMGIVGSGFITRFQATALRQVRGVELAGITERRRSPEIVELARRLGIYCDGLYADFLNRESELRFDSRLLTFDRWASSMPVIRS